MEDGPRTILASRSGDAPDYWFYLPRGRYAFYWTEWDAGLDVFAHYKTIYADPTCARFIAMVDAR
jgi:hypothetical protein